MKHHEPEVLGPLKRAGERVVASGQRGLRGHWHDRHGL